AGFEDRMGHQTPAAPISVSRIHQIPDESVGERVRVVEGTRGRVVLARVPVDGTRAGLPRAIDHGVDQVAPDPGATRRGIDEQVLEVARVADAPRAGV